MLQNNNQTTIIDQRVTAKKMLTIKITILHVKRKIE